MIFAEAASSFDAPVGIAAWLGCAAFVVMLLNQGMKFVDRVKDKPAPGDVRAESADKFLPKEVFIRHVEENKSEHTRLFDLVGGVDDKTSNRLETQIQLMRGERHSDSVETHKRINAIEKSIGGLETAANLNNQTLAALGAKLDRISEKQNRS